MVEALPYDGGEEDEVRSALRILDPNRKSDREYKEGLWDGYRDFNLGGSEIRFTRGHLGYVQRELRSKGVEYVVELDPLAAEIDTELTDFEPPKPWPGILRDFTLRDYQVAAIRKVLHHRRGIVYAPPRSGKTAIAIAVAKLLDLPSLLLVNRAKLIRQHARVAEEYGLDVQVLGGKGKGKRKERVAITKKHVFATVQTIYNALKRDDQEILDWLHRVRVLQGDEIHFLSDSQSWIASVLETPAIYRVGYSGTPFRSDDEWDYRDWWLRGCFGPLIFHVDVPFLIEHGFLAPTKVFQVRLPGNPRLFMVKSWPVAYNVGVVKNKAANRSLAKLAAHAAKCGRTVLLLCYREDHGRALLGHLKDLGLNSLFSLGADRCLEIDESDRFVERTYSDKEILQRFETGATSRVLVGSTIYDQGLDLPFVDTVVMAGGWKAKTTVVQRAYRCMTATKWKEQALIIDAYHGFNVILRSHSLKRQQEFSNSILDGGVVRLVTSEQMMRILDANQPARLAR